MFKGKIQMYFFLLYGFLENLKSINLREYNIQTFEEKKTHFEV